MSPIPASCPPSDQPAASATALRPTLRWRIAAAPLALRLLVAAAAVVAAHIAPAPPGAAAPATCTADDFARAVDEAGASLRQFNTENAPKLNAKLRQLKQTKGWNDDDEDMALDYLSDRRLTDFDGTANELLARIDTLGRPPADKTLDCAKLDELKAASLELVAVMKAKSSYMTGKIDAELAASGGAKPAEPATAAKPGEAGKATVDVGKHVETGKGVEIGSAPAAGQRDEASKVAPKPAPAPAPQQQAALPPPKAPAPPPVPAAKPTPAPPPAPGAQPAAKPGRVPDSAWSTTTEEHASNDAPPVPVPAAPAGAAPPSPGFVPPEEGYTIEEIRDASQGFFGSVSTNLAAVIEHTFSSLGRPTGYVLGTEGGGAFLAGLRYGSGMLYMRSGGARPVHWHGPSLGYDFGAAGSRTLFLIYGMHNQSELFRTYTGIDGSAYVIGGVGVTFLKGGDVTMAPIRSGIGLRVGANIGYVRFTSEPSWNPF